MAMDQTNGDGWGGPVGAIDGYKALQSFQLSLHPPDHDAVSYESPAQESFRLVEPGVCQTHGVSIFRDAVETARRAIPQPLDTGEMVDELKLKLTVDLSHTHLEDIPPEVADILKRDVDKLVLSHNQICQIPYRFSECTPLKYLNLRANRFREFPKAIYKLPQLEILDLSRNRLTRIPEEIKDMKALRVLSVLNNNINDVPFCVGYLDTLRVLKLAGNPLTHDLKRIVDSSDGSPSRSTIDYEKDALLTKRVKKYLKAAAAAASESGGESSSEGPLETPRPFKRPPSIRFPVNPTTSGSESASDLISPGFSRLSTHPRAHYRVASGPNAALQNAATRRPGPSPVSVGNERNRSNSESVLQATAAQSIRTKRMGMVPRRNYDLGTVDETRTNRFSHHYRGLSHGSVLRDKHSNGVRHGSTNPASPSLGERQANTFVRRLSSLPEHKRESHHPNNIVEAAKGVLWSLYQVHPLVATLTNVVEEGASKRSSLERVYYNASTHLEYLDKQLHVYDSISDVKKEERVRSKTNVRNACSACVMAFQQIGSLLLHSVPQLVSDGDPRCIRTLLLLIYGALVESRNACSNLGVSITDVNKSKDQGPAVLAVPEERLRLMRDRSATPTRDRPNGLRRLRSATTSQHSNSHGHYNTVLNAHSAVPLYANGRSRSNSRTSTLSNSGANSVVNTPHSETFAATGMTASQSSNSHPSRIFDDSQQDALFGKIFLTLKESVNHGLRACPAVILQFTKCFEVAQNGYVGKEIVNLWSRLISRSRFCLELCEVLELRLSTIKLGARNDRDFWKLCIKFINSFVKLLSGIREAKVLDLVPLNIIQTLRPVQKTSRAAFLYINSSPWVGLVNDSAPALPTFNGHRRGSGSGVSYSPYNTSVPATPLSAALGPAAQATVPSTPASATSLDRSFQGDVFQRADSLLSMQQTMLYRR